MVSGFKPIKVESSKSDSFFETISNNLKFEDDSEKNAEKDNNTAQQNGNTNNDSSKDDSLDKSLDKLKEEKSKKEQKNDERDPSSSSPDDGTDKEETSDLAGQEDSGEGEDNSSETEPSSSIQQDDTSSSTNDVPSGGPVNRKLTIYSEFSRIYNTLKESVESLSELQTNDDKIKSCVAQLQDATNATRFIMSGFEGYSDQDAMIHLQLIKDRVSIIMEQLSRLKKN